MLMRKQIFYIILALLTLPVVIFAQRQIQELLSRAALREANIVIDTKNVLGPVDYSWSAFAQGGEEPPPMLSKVVDKLRSLKPRYIRIDHIYDSYSVVQRGDNGFKYDFSRLDGTVNDIIASGAVPFLSLSYMPSVFTTSGSLVDPPSDWNDWKNLVRATIEHYSGKNNRNLKDVYYEVWNEPELPQFGGWKLSGGKDYRLLYFYSATGASEAVNVNKFYFGGPSVGSYYPNWVNDFVSYVAQNNLRLDFYSWHRYIKNPDNFATDARNIRKNLSRFPSYATIPLILSEWGMESENTEVNNTSSAASFSIAAISKFHNDLQLAFNFEIKDGPPGGGKWGLFTHESDPNKGLSPKPRFYAFEVLSQMVGNQLGLSGEGTFVTGLASSSPQGITAVLSNYDPSGSHTENVPVAFTGLAPSSYLLKYSYPLEQLSGSYELIATSGIISKTFLMSANSILLLTLTPIAPIATFIQGESGLMKDKALVLGNTGNLPLIFAFPEFKLMPNSFVSFDIKPFWDESDNRSFLIYEAPFSTISGVLNKLFLAKQKMPSGNFLVFGISKENEELSISQPISAWQKDKWHHLETKWDAEGLSLSVDNEKVDLIQPNIDIRNGRILTFYPIDAAIDNLKINISNQQVIQRMFDGRIDL